MQQTAILKRRNPGPASDKLREEAKSITEQARRLLRDASEGLVFEPVQHRYTLGDREMESVSMIIKEFTSFDPQKTAEGCSRNPRHEHYGRSVQEILEIWEDKKNAAAAAGTQIHEFGEACCLYWEGRPELIEEPYRCRIHQEGFIATSPKEAAMTAWWNDLDPDRYCIVAKEARVVNPILGYAGTFDLLLYDMVDKMFELKDYKTNENLHKWFGGYLNTPLNRMPDSDIGKYTMQQNMYGIQLDNIGIPTSRMVLIWLKEDGKYEEVKLDDKYRKIITYALENRIKEHETIHQ